MQWRALLVGMLAYRAVRADSPPVDPIALSLFTDGKHLADAGDYPLACAKFEAAYARAVWLGIEINLADCYEHVGRTASAWMLFVRATERAAQDRDDREAFARDRATRLASQLAYLAIDADAADAITLDGIPILAGAVKAPLPVDPGDHVVEASAQGHVTWSAHVVVAIAAAATIRIPPLAEVTPPKPEAEPAPSPHDTTSLAPRLLVRETHHVDRRVAILGASSAAALLTSAALGVVALRRYYAARGDHCDSRLVCDDYGYSELSGARLDGNTATAFAIAGLTLAGTTFYFYVHDARTSIAPLVLDHGGGIAIGGAL